MDTLTSEELKKILEKILKRITCPICLSNLRPPVALCENGHGTCPDCKAQVATCALCRKPFLNMKVRLLDEVLEVIPQLCRFDGCQVIVKRADKHETWCGYRQTDCKMNECEWKGCVMDLPEHIQKDHEALALLAESGNRTWYPNCVTPYEEPLNWFNPILAYGNIFWRETTKVPQDKLLKLAFYCLPLENIVDSFQITITLEKDKKKYSTSILMPNEDLMSEEKNCIYLPFSLVQAFINNEGIIQWTFLLKRE